jgi:NAD kinase
MSEKQFDCVLDTHSKEERKNLIDYITNKDGLIVSIIDDFEGFQFVGVHRGTIGFLSAIASRDFEKNQSDKHFASVEEYIAYSEGK